MKKSIFTLFSFFALIALVYGISQSSDLNSSVDSMEVATLPKEALSQISPEIISNLAQTSKLLIFYNTDCEHCQYELQTLSKHPDFQNQLILWISANKEEEIAAFKTAYAAKIPDNFHFMQDPGHQLGNQMGIRTYPTLFIYDQHDQLLRKYEGETKPSAILKYLNDEYQEAQ